MRKLSAVFLGLALLLLPRAALAEDVVLFSAQTTNINSPVYDLAGSMKVIVQVTTTGTPVGTFTLYCKNLSTDSYTVAFTVSNPSGVPPYVGPGACYCYGSVESYVSGTWTATMRTMK
jgi:hypothetical protein